MYYLSLLLFSFFSFLSIASVGLTLQLQHSRNHVGGTIRHEYPKRTDCQPFNTTFSSVSEISRSPGVAPFLGISPEGTYAITRGGLQLFLQKPTGRITKQNITNDIVAEGATVNSTFELSYGKVTFEVEAPSVAGVVVAAILYSDGHDEIDVELVCGDPRHWQTNVYAPRPQDKQPLWGVFGDIHNVGSGESITTQHSYTVDWTKERIIWSVDGHVVRTLTPLQTSINGTEHYPTERSRISLGIWDASNPEGTSEWAKGPINWDKVPSTISATVRGLSVECV